MTIDLYMKAVFTVIAISLAVIAARQDGGPKPAIAQTGSECGKFDNPCYVAGVYRPGPYDDYEDGMLVIQRR